MKRVSRQVDAPSITLATIRSVRELKEFESTYKAPSGDAPTINAKDWPKTMEASNQRTPLIHPRGTEKVPLPFVVRKNEDIPTGDDPSTCYPTK